MSTQSLPSFAQAFSTIPANDALPPIMHSRKRTVDADVHVKQEDPAPPPSALMPAPKKRRVTVSGAPQPLHIDVPAAQPASTPISPVVIGFPVHRDNPAAMDQVRSMLSVKQKQKALIEQRRGSAAGPLSPATPVDDRPPPGTTTPRPARRTAPPPRPPSPPPPIPQHSLPPPPISFARRRAALMNGKRKPADILISPREAHTRDQLQPAIQSAPPVPGATQGQFYGARFTMALPRLPTITGAENPRRVAGNVPPTPTRLAMQQQQQHQGPHPPGLHPPSVPLPARSPPASIPIAATRVPPTPTTLTRAGSAYARAGDSDRAAFLAPFELFYDALGDARTLKGWLGDQLRESRALLSALGAAQDRRAESVDAAVERRMGSVNAELAALRRRVEELEAAPRHANGEAYTFPPADAAAAGPSRMRPEPPRRLSSPASGWGDPRDREWERRSDQDGSPQMGRREPGAGEREREREYMERERERERDGLRERERDGLRDRERERDRDREGRRNSVVMAAPEEEEEDDEGPGAQRTA